MKFVDLASIFIVLLCCAFLTTNVVETNAIEGRIVSGTPAAKGQFPWQVILKKNEIDHLLCGGSVISNYWVLTAAHCTYTLSSILMVFGTINLDDTAINMTSTQMYIHPLYNSSNLNNDVSLIQLPEPLTFSSVIQPIALVSSSQASNSFIGTKAIIAGFGLMDDEYLDYSQNLLWAKVEIIDNIYCTAVFGVDAVKNTNLCAKGSDNTNMSICSGDSGGPLIMQTTAGQYVQIGINSFVAEDMCTESYPSGYVRVTSYLNYISTISGIDFN